MVVYRVESRDGTGPYKGFITDARHYEDNCPDPISDGIWTDFDEALDCVDYYYGFTSIEAAAKWFGAKWLTKLSRTQYSLYKFDVPKSNVREGYRHCAFKRKDCFRKRKVKREEILLH